jgi:hypothetical protein
MRKTKVEVGKKGMVLAIDTETEMLIPWQFCLEKQENPTSKCRKRVL